MMQENIKKKKNLFTITVPIHITRFHPAAGHLHRLGPLAVHLLTLDGRDMGGERGAVGAVHVAKLAELLPHAHGEPGGDGGAQSGRLVHRGSLDGDLDDIGLGLVLISTGL